MIRALGSSAICQTFIPTPVIETPAWGKKERVMRKPIKAQILLATTLLTAMAEAAVFAAPPAATVHPEIWPQANWPYLADPKLESRIARLIEAMSLEEKVGQVIQADIASVTPDEVRRYHLGSILNGGNSAPGNDEFAPPAKWLELADAFYDASVDKRGGRTAIPILWGTDAVHGHSNIVGATLFPHNVGLGAMRDPDLIEKIAQATAIELRTTGIEWTFAPTIAVPQDLRWGRAYEGYSSDSKLVASYVGRFIRGLQGQPSPEPLLNGPHVLASTKHFLADGGTFEGRDQGDARISEAELRDVHGTPYVPAVDAGVQTVMASFSSWNGEKLTGHKGLLTDILKKRMGFGGFVVSDWNAHGQVAGCTNASCPQAINAGIDMYMAPDTWKPLWHSLLAQVKDGTVPVARLNEAVGNILRVKLRAGLFEAGRPSARPWSGRFDLLGGNAHRALAREAVRKSLVLLKNDGLLLPLKPSGTILVAGDGADDIARQSGGWTLTWQGTGIPRDKFPGATSIWQGIHQAVTAAGGRAELAPDGRFTQRPDAAIVVFGETPYAEFQGDLDSLQLKPELRSPLETMRNLKAQGIPVVALFISGRPLWVNPELNAADAFVAGWLPGSEGAGIADLLLRAKDGRVAHDFQGRLSFAWPATANAKGPTLFPLGYGLSITDSASAPRLSEDAGLGEASGASGRFFDKGLPAASWSLVVTDRGPDSTRITTVPASALAGRMRVSAVDHVTQEGARRFQFNGDGGAAIQLTSHAPADLSRETNGDLMLVMTMRLDKAPAQPLRLSASCGESSCRGEVALPALSRQPLGQWRTLGLPLKCLSRGGADMARVQTVFELSGSGAFDLSLSRVEVGTVADAVLGC
jgi:beta-glucosidase